MQVRLFHRTTEHAAESILADGFRDGTGLGQIEEGVFLSLVPLTCHEGAKGNVVLEVMIEISVGELFFNHEVIEEGKPYREFLFAADILNKIGRMRRLTGEEIEWFESESYLRSKDFWNEYPPGEPEKTWSESRRPCD